VFGVSQIPGSFVVRLYRLSRAILFAVEITTCRLGFLFDLDGVLINSMPLHTRAWEVYLQRLGIEAVDIEARMHGKRNPELVRDLIAADLPEDVVFEHGAAKERLFRELMAAEIERCGIPGLVDFLQKYRDVPKAVASNAERANIEFTLRSLGLENWFEVIVDGWEVERPKPFPDMYLMAAERLGMTPRECIVFEDSPVGAAAGKAAGMRTVGVETIPTEFAGLDLVIRDFRDERLESWLRAQTSSGKETIYERNGK
jgi:HAD superfamily hydrolase (TIGR01509 family)